MAAIQNEPFVTELRHSTFDLLVISVSVISAALLWLGNIYTRTSSGEIVLLWLALEALCGLAYVLRRKTFQVSIYVLLIGLWLLNALAYAALNQVACLYLFALISLATSVLISRLPAVIVTLVSSAFVIMVQADSAYTFPALLTLWLTLLAGFIAFHGLCRALDLALNYQAYAIQQMDEARQHRAELMRLTKALQEARQDLERANGQLAYARNVAEEARRFKAQFAANVSHELRTPINLIVGFSELMVQSPGGYRTPLPSVYWTDMNTIYRSAKHLQSLINDVLDISQIEAGQMAVLKEEIKPQQVISEAANLARDLIESRGLAFSVIVPDNLPSVWLDRIRIRQVLLNLLSNAARFTDQGSITLSANVEGDYLKIAVSDTGIGIRKDDLDRVFEEFHQLEAGLSRRVGGSGLGLTLSKQFVELHGGRIWVESVPGQGSTFTIALPLVQSPALQHPQFSRESAQHGGKERSFVILDDDPAIRQLFERYTSKHKGISATSVEEAERLMKTIQPSALVVDTAHSANVREIAGSTPVISCSMPSGRRTMQLYGATDYLVKPVSRAGLFTALDHLNLRIHTILLIDDDPDVVRMFSRMLQTSPQDYDVWKAYGGKEGLAQMEQLRPDAVILDLLMPEVDGFEVIRQMKANPTLSDVPIVMITAYGAMETIEASANGELSVFKPAGFQPIELVRCIEALVEEFRPATEPAR